jgi:predicted nicotinamide N-methyase
VAEARAAAERARRGDAPLVVERVAVAGRSLRVVRPPDAEALIDEDAFERDEFLPYWADLWPSALSLARAAGRLDLRGKRIVELGCGLALPSVVAALAGARVLATDWSEDALAFARRNARLNGAYVETLRCSWAEPGVLLPRAPFDLALASDVLYERPNAGLLLELLPQLAPAALVADPGRPALAGFLEAARARWRLERDGLVYRLTAAGT